MENVTVPIICKVFLLAAKYVTFSQNCVWIIRNHCELLFRFLLVFRIVSFTSMEEYFTYHLSPHFISDISYGKKNKQLPSDYCNIWCSNNCWNSLHLEGSCSSALAFSLFGCPCPCKEPLYSTLPLQILWHSEARYCFWWWWFYWT